MQELLGQLKEVVTQSTCYDEIVSGVSLVLLNENYWIDKELDSLDEKHQEGWDNALYEMERWTAKNKPKNGDEFFSPKPNQVSVEQQVAMQIKAGKQNNPLNDIFGKWPGDETDEEFNEMMKSLD